MSAVDSETRQSRIVEFARTRGRVEVLPLAEELHVASETIRRDLKVLAGRRLLKRVHGGAVPLETVAFESTVEYRSQVDLAQKHRIAAAAVELLHGSETVYLDEGFTPRLIAEKIADRELTVVTSSLLAAEALAHSDTVTVLLLGGRMRGRTLATVDHWAVERLRTLVIDVAYLAPTGSPWNTASPHRTRPWPRSSRRPYTSPGAGSRGRPHEVRGDQLLPVRRGVGFRIHRHRIRTADGRGAPV